MPQGLSDEQVLFLSDILPTGFEVGVLNGNVCPGDVVAVVGAGPVGLAAMMTARLYGPSRVVAIDKADSRLEKARSQFGADVTVNSDADDPAEVVMGLTDGPGADVAIEAVGIPRPSSSAPTWYARAAASPTWASTATPPPCTWRRSGSGTSPSPPAWSTPDRPRPCSAWSPRAARPRSLATHRFTLDQMMDAYEVFADAAKTNALKMVPPGPDPRPGPLARGCGRPRAGHPAPGSPPHWGTWSRTGWVRAARAGWCDRAPDPGGRGPSGPDGLMAARVNGHAGGRVRGYPARRRAW